MSFHILYIGKYGSLSSFRLCYCSKYSDRWWHRRQRSPRYSFWNHSITCKSLISFSRLSLSPVLSAPPQAVSVVQLSNSSSISVSWEPPPHNIQSGIIQEYKVRLQSVPGCTWLVRRHLTGTERSSVFFSDVYSSLYDRQLVLPAVDRECVLKKNNRSFTTRCFDFT